MYFINIFTWPGYQSSKYAEWELTTSLKLYQACSAFWLIINVLSTIITIYAIKKIFNTVQELCLSNSKVDIDRKTMSLHASVLVLQSCIAIIYVIILYKEFDSKTIMII